MSTIDLTTLSEFAKIPLLRRIVELVEDKGMEFSRRSLAAMCGLNRETVRKIFNEEQQLTLPFLKNIASGLGVTVDRLRQLDTVKREKELNTILTSNKRTKVLLMRALDLAKELVDLALGVTERGYALNNLGRVLYFQENYDKAHEIWLDAFEFAKRMEENHDDSNLLHIVSVNLMLTYTIRKEYSNIDGVFQIVERAFPNHPTVMGKCFYTRMKMEEYRGNLELAKKYSYKSLEHFTKTNNDSQIGKALLNVANYEFALGNYNESATILSTAIEHSKNFEDTLIACVKDYVKSLMKLRDYATVIRIVDEYLELAKEYPEYLGKLKIMYAVAKKEPSIAESVMNDSTLSVAIRCFASKCLLEYYYLNGDSESVMRYYEKVRIYSNTKSEYLDKEGF